MSRLQVAPARAPDYGYPPDSYMSSRSPINYGGELIVSEIVRSITSAGTVNKKTFKKILQLIAGSIVAKYAVENAEYLVKYPADILKEIFKFLTNIKLYSRFIWNYWTHKYKAYVFHRINSPATAAPAPGFDLKPIQSQYTTSLNYNNETYNVFGKNRENRWVYLMPWVDYYEEGLYINFEGIMIVIHANSEQFEKMLTDYKISSNSLIELGGQVVSQTSGPVVGHPSTSLYSNYNLDSPIKNTTKYTFETKKYKELGDMIQESIKLNIAIGQYNGANTMFCFSGKPGTGKTLFGYYLQNKKICDRVMRINLIKSDLGNMELKDIFKMANSSLKTNNVIIIEELDRYFDKLVGETASIKDLDCIQAFKDSKQGPSDQLIHSEQKSIVSRKVINFINMLHLLADGEMVDGNNIIIINTNNLESMFKKIIEYGAKETVIEALRNRIQMINFEYPEQEEVCNIIFDMYSKQQKGFTYKQIQDAVPKDISISMRDLDAKIIQAYGDLDRLKTLLENAKSVDIEPQIIDETYDSNQPHSLTKINPNPYSQPINSGIQPQDQFYGGGRGYPFHPPTIVVSSADNSPTLPSRRAIY